MVQDNVQFSGHLGTMLGLFERAGGDDRYDRGFRLADPASGVAYDYTHSGVAERIVSQMRANYFHGVACEPACAYVPCNNHAMTCNAIHDATHGTDYRAANADWLAWVRRKMVLRGPAGRGLFGACFLRDMGDFAAFNEVYAGFFPEPYPARTTVQAARLPMDIAVEIEAIAVRH